jgi:hypothetical protein
MRQYEQFVGFGFVRDLEYGDVRTFFASSLSPAPVMAAIRHSYRRTFTLYGSGVIIPYWFLVLLAGMAVATTKLRWPPRISLRGALAAMTFSSVLLGLGAWLDLSAPR